MSIVLQSHKSGRDHYDELYRNELAWEAEWLRRGALDKADSIERLLARNAITPESLLELGAGTGAVIAECQRREIAKRFLAIDYSSTAVEYLREHVPGVIPIQADINALEQPFDETFDVLVLSHVVEHLERPQEFLQSVRRNLKFQHVVIEVPLEDLPVGRLKARLIDRGKNPAGHVQFFTKKRVQELVRANGYEIVDQHTYFPIPTLDTLRLLARKESRPVARLTSMFIMRRLMPSIAYPVWVNVVHAHHAMLCRPV